MSKRLNTEAIELQRLLTVFASGVQTVRKYQRLLASRASSRAWRNAVLLFLFGLSFSFTAIACSSSTAPTARSSTNAQPAELTLNLVSFSVTQAAHEKIIPKFVAKWQQEHNQTVAFETSYGGSGSQTLAVIEGGQEADVVHLSLAPDVQKLEQAGLIQPGWEQKFAHDSIVSQSVVALVTRAGNPKAIKDWSDLARDDVSVLTPNPKSSGGARWNFLALWNSVLKTGGNEAKALEFVTKVYQNAPLLPDTAREATEAFFKGGQGDVLITYENEVILKALGGETLPYLVPETNFSIENPAAIVDKNVDRHGTREVAEAFINYLSTPEAQQEFAQIGYRPIDPNAVPENELNNRYGEVKSLATAQDYGDWSEVQKKFFDEGALFDEVLRNREAK